MGIWEWMALLVSCSEPKPFWMWITDSSQLFRSHHNNYLLILLLPSFLLVNQWTPQSFGPTLLGLMQLAVRTQVPWSSASNSSAAIGALADYSHPNIYFQNLYKWFQIYVNPLWTPWFLGGVYYIGRDGFHLLSRCTICGLRMHFLKIDQEGFRTPWTPGFSFSAIGGAGGGN